MLKKTITYIDYDGVKRTEDFYFNLTKAELIEMQVNSEEGIDAIIDRARKSEDVRAIYNIFKGFVLGSYGEKTPDGKHFLKKKNGEQLCEYFEQSEAYGILMEELMNDGEAANNFILGIIPSELAAEVAAQQAKLIQG